MKSFSIKNVVFIGMELEQITLHYMAICSPRHSACLVGSAVPVLDPAGRSTGDQASAGATSPSGGGDHAEHLAALAVRAAALAGLPAVDPIWSPPLPAVVPASAVAELARRTAPT